MNYIDKLKSVFLPRTGVAQIVTDTPKLGAWRAYEGRFPACLKPSRTDPNADDNIVLPVVAQIVDTSVAALMGPGIRVDVVGENEDDAQAYLDAFLLRSRLNTTVKKAAVNGAVVGHIFLKLLIGVDGKPDRFQALNSQSVLVETDPRDAEQAVAFTITWEAYNPQTRRTDKYQEETRHTDGDTWLITESVADGGRGAWRMVSQTVWPFAYAPIFDAQNLTNALGYWGRPDASAAVIAQNESLNMVYSLSARLLRTHASPKTVVTGLNGQKIDWQVDGAMALPEGAGASQLELSAGGASALLELGKTLREAIHTTSRTPECASGKIENTGNLSGTALAILFKPLVEKTAEKRLHLEEMLESLCQHVLELGGFEGRGVEVVWPNTTPSSAVEDRNVALLDRQLGVASLESVSKQLGYSFEDEQAQIAAEGTNAGGAILSALNAGD